MDFTAFIRKDVDENKNFVLGPSDQGAYLDFYHAYKNDDVPLDHEASKYVQHLDPTFNVKPYYTFRKKFNGRRIIHFHGLKPHDLLKNLMGYKREDFPIALHILLDQIDNDENNFVCLTLQDFGTAIVEDKETLHNFCQMPFSKHNEKTACVDFLVRLVSFKARNENCMDLMKSFVRTKPCPEGEKVYLTQNPDVAKSVKEENIVSGFDHWRKYGHKVGHRSIYKCEA